MGHRSALYLLAVLLISVCAGCQSTYYAVWEKLGKDDAGAHLVARLSARFSDSAMCGGSIYAAC
jgi:hypothetical protein